MTELQLLLICNALTGAAARVLMAFFMAGTALDIKGLVKWTRMERHAIDLALKQLKDYGLVVHQAMAHNRVVWMLATSVFPGMRKSDQLGQGGENFQNEVFPQTGSLSSSSSESKSLVASYLPQEEEESQNEVFPQTGKEVLAALNEAGIREPKRSILARLPHVTPDFIKAHVEQAKREGLALGTAIHRIEFNWDVDITIVKRNKNPNGHDHNCICRQCRDARSNVAMGILCPDCWKTLNDECKCSESENE